MTMDISNLIIENLANPHELERMYRKEPEAFKKSISYAWGKNPDSQVLAVWYERLHFKETANTEKTSLFQKDFLSMGILAMLAGISTRGILHTLRQHGNQRNDANSINHALISICRYGYI